MKQKVVLTGPCPRNIGGISMHLSRLTRLLDNECQFDFVDEGHVRYDNVFNLRSFNLGRYLSIMRKADVVHINSGHFLLRMVNIIVAKLLLRKHTVVTIHRNPDVEPCLTITRWLLNKCDHVVMVNQEGYNLMTKGIANARYVMQPAFLPPVIDEEPQLPSPVIEWFKKAQTYSGHCVLVSNAWNLVMHNGEDLYGLDLCIQAAIKLRKLHQEPKFFFVFVVATCTDHIDMLNRYIQQVQVNGLEDQFLIWTSPLSFVRLLSYSDIMLRTTNTDGDAISVREALYMGKKVIASDVVQRPQGVMLFENRNADSLVDAIEQSDKQQHSITADEQLDYKKFYLELYKSDNETIDAKTS